MTQASTSFREVAWAALSQLDYPIETERLSMRPFTWDDFDSSWEIIRHEEVTRYLLRAYPSKDAFRAFFAERKLGKASIVDGNEGINLGVFLRSTGDLVGDVTFWVRSREHRNAEIGWMFHPEHQGKGYAREASEIVMAILFDDWGMHRVEGRLDARNDRSARLLERLGMRREAHFVRNEFIQGEWTDELVYAILEEEWREQRA